jgi:hypothetical protein
MLARMPEPPTPEPSAPEPPTPEPPAPESSSGSALAERSRDPDPVIDAVDHLLGVAADQSRLIAQLALVLDALVAERLGDPAPEAGELERRWAGLASLLAAHAAALEREAGDDRAAPR